MASTNAPSVQYLPRNPVECGRVIWHLGSSASKSAVAFTESYGEFQRATLEHEPSYRVQGALIDGFDRTTKSMRTLFPGARLGYGLRHALNKIPNKLVGLAVPVRNGLRSTFSPKNAGKPRRSRRGWIGVGRAGLNAQAANIFLCHSGALNGRWSGEDGNPGIHAGEDVHQSFVFRLARDLASPTHRRVPKALQIIYRIIRPDTVANPDREVDGCTTITYHAMHGRVDATHILNRQTL